MALPQINHDELPLVTKYLKAGYVGYKGKVNPGADKILAKFPGAEFVQVVQDRRDAKGNVYHSDMQQIVILDQGWRSVQGGGSGGGGSAGGGSFNAAANAMTKQFTGGGTGIGLGATDSRNIQAAIEGAFTGLNLAAADYKLPQGKSPDAVNVDGIHVDGSVGPRPGLVQTFPRRYNSIVGTGGAIAAARKGRSLNMLSPAMWQSGQATGVVTYDNSSIGATAATSQTVTIFKATYPAWNAQHPISGTQPRILLISNAAGVVQFTVAMPDRFRARTVANQGNALASVDQLVVRYSRISYPRDRDGREAFSLAVAGSTAIKNYTSWDGTSTTVAQSGVSTGATMYYSAWAINKDGVSKPARFSVVFA